MRTVSTPSTGVASRLVAPTRPAYPDDKMLWRATKPNLPGCAERAGDDDAPRLEQRPERVVGRTRRRFGGGRSGSLVELDERVDRYGLAVDDDQRVEIDRLHVGTLPREAGQPEQGGRDRVAVDRGFSAERSEQVLGGEVVEQVSRIEVAQRDETERDVAERFGEHTTDPQHDARSELRIADEAGDELACAAYHRRDEQPDRAVVGAGRGEQFLGREAHRGRVGQSEADESPLGLVRDRVAAQLDHDRKADRAGRRDRVVDGGHGALVEHRHTEFGEEQLRRGFGEGRHRGRG